MDLGQGLWPWKFFPFRDSPVLLLIPCLRQHSLSSPKILGLEVFPQEIHLGESRIATSDRDPMKVSIPKFTGTTGKLLCAVLHHIPTFSLAQKSAFPQKPLIFPRIPIISHNLLDLGKPFKLWRFFWSHHFRDEDSKQTFKQRILLGKIWNIWDIWKIWDTENSLIPAFPSWPSVIFKFGCVLREEKQRLQGAPEGWEKLWDEGI